MPQAQEILEHQGLKATPNRILVVRQLMEAEAPMSLIDLEYKIMTMDRSSILRVLVLLRDKDLVHAVEDGRGVTKYELCHDHHNGDHLDRDMHVHFYCTQCERMVCFDDIPTPVVSIPSDYKAISINYMIKGLCPQCQEKDNNGL